jgi:hypothetical protein
MEKIKLFVFTLSLLLLCNPCQASQEEKYIRKYMMKVQQKIKKNWHPPKRKKSYSLTATFDLGLDGKIAGPIKFNQKIDDSEIMQSARDAIEKAVPFKKMNQKYIKEKPGIEFKFDYNVLSTIDDDGDLPIQLIRQKR